MDINIGQKVTISSNLASLFGDIYAQVALGGNVLKVEQKGDDWIVFRDEASNRPWYISFGKPGHFKAFLELITYV